MDTQTAEVTLEDYLLQGIAKEIFIADEARSLCVEIGNYASQINTQGYGQLFGSLQVAYSDRQTLAVTKMFDPKSRKYPTRSIPAIINLIEKNASVWLLPQPQVLREILVSAGHDLQTIMACSNTQLVIQVCRHFQSTLPQVERASACGLSLSLITLKEARDKVIAHNEAVAQSARTLATWGETEALVRYAKNFATVISFGFLNLHMGGDANTYRATADARMTSIAMKRLLQIANLVE